MRAVVSVLLLCGAALLPGCAAQMQQSITNLDTNWGATNARIVQELGTRYYKIDPEKAQRAMLIALSNLSLIVEQQDAKSGFINARANAPIPLSLPEWDRVSAAELTNARAIAGSSSLELSAKNREVVINSFILQRATDVQINLRFRLKYTGNTYGLVVGDQPPPEALRIAVRKIFDEFEKVAFVQQTILDTKMP